MTFATQGFHHLTTVSADAARTVRFYRDILGLGLVKRTVNFDDPSAYHLYFGDDAGRPGTLVTYFEWRDAPRGTPGIGGIHHLALGVHDVPVLLQWKRWLTDHGVRVTGPRDRGYFTSLYFTDPDGQILELATAGPGYDLDEPADRLGQAEVAPPAERLPGSDAYRAMDERTHPDPVPALTPEMAIDGIHHITGITRDLDVADRFYRETLGLAMVKRTVNQDDGVTPHHFWARVDGGRVVPGSALTLFGWPPTGKPARGGAGQTHHIAFRARDEEEQLAWREHLLGLGLRVTEVMDRTYFRTIYFRAPDGLLLEIATDGPGFLVDEPAGALGERLMLPAWLEDERGQIERALVPL